MPFEAPSIEGRRRVSARSRTNMVKKTKKEMTFKEAFEKMEEISRRLESADLEVEEGMALVQEAEKLHQFLQKKLREAKLVVKEKE